MRPLDQLGFLAEDFERIVNGRWWRYVGAPFSAGFLAVASYRLDRTAYLALGSVWQGLRVCLAPIGMLLRPWHGRCEIHYRADIGPGLVILHPGLGVVVAGGVRIGSHLTLVGGNCIGRRDGDETTAFSIGSDVSLGANAIILGPVIVGDRVRVGAGAVVVNHAPSDVTLVGIPARPV